MPFQFCNVDLDIRSSSPLDAIRSHFSTYGDRVLDLYCGEIEAGVYLASFEIHWDETLYPDDADGNPGGPERWGVEEMISAFCDLISRFPSDIHELWSTATSRVFDIGYEADDHCQPLKVAIPMNTLNAAVAVGAEIAFTVYPKSFGSTDSSFIR